jgi:hypothetical protein
MGNYATVITVVGSRQAVKALVFGAASGVRILLQERAIQLWMLFLFAQTLSLSREILYTHFLVVVYIPIMLW